jgi:hypothetical protein
MDDLAGNAKNFGPLVVLKGKYGEFASAQMDFTSRLEKLTHWFLVVRTGHSWR